LRDLRLADREVVAGTPGCGRGGPERLADCTRGNPVVIVHVPSGCMSSLVNGRVVDFATDSMYVFWAVTPHKLLRAREATQASHVTLPFSCLFDWPLPTEFVRRLLEGHVVGQNTQGAGDERLFDRWERDLASGGQGSRDVALLEMRARLLRFALKSRWGTQGTVEPKLTLSAVEQLAAYVALHYPERLSARAMSERLHPRPGYAMALFRKSFGISLGRYVAHHRIAHAVRLLATTDLPVRDIAQVSGFATLRRMSTAFRGALRCSPAEFRRRHRLAPVADRLP